MSEYAIVDRGGRLVLMLLVSEVNVLISLIAARLDLPCIILIVSRSSEVKHYNLL